MSLLRQQPAVSIQFPVASFFERLTATGGPSKSTESFLLYLLSLCPTSQALQRFLNPDRLCLFAAIPSYS
ncbi:hypothetical protein MRB53_002529 [Persea americana]|uniref:Uncharacterized protein n=1 Tax=Persea americana TaxID=3435 RepID=A0ACC2MVM2_PERAE|nr:hypothetical protein MRB53_002529 [Persea americana]